MQSNVNFSNFHSSVQHVIDVVKERLGAISIDEAIAIHEDYQSDDSTTVCGTCLESVRADDLLYVVDNDATWDNPMEAHNECPHCGQETSPYDLAKPDFETWLKLTA